MARKKTLYPSALTYKKPFEEKKLEKKEIERMVTYAGNQREKKKERMYVFSGKSVEELILCATKARKVYGMLRMPVARWREEFANTLDTVLRKKWDQVETDGDDAGDPFAQTAAGFDLIIRYFIRTKCPDPRALRTQKTAFGEDEYQFNPKGDIDVDDHTLRIQSLFENAKWLRGTEVMDDDEEKNILFDTFPLRWRDRFIQGELNKYDDSTIQEIIAFMRYISNKEEQISESQAAEKKKRKAENETKEKSGRGRHGDGGRGRGRDGGRGRGSGRGYQGKHYNPNYHRDGGRGGRGGGAGRGGRGNRGGYNNYNNNGGRYNNNGGRYNNGGGNNPYQQQRQENHYNNNGYNNGQNNGNNDGQGNYHNQQDRANNGNINNDNQNFHNEGNRWNGPSMW
jgi:hypothetical protein